MIHKMRVSSEKDLKEPYNGKSLRSTPGSEDGKNAPPTGKSLRQKSSSSRAGLTLSHYHQYKRFYRMNLSLFYLCTYSD